MWKRKRTWLLLLALVGVALAVYFEPGRRVRGWLHGEAFFDRRPTSYWRERIDIWLERFQSEEDAIRFITVDPLAISPRGPEPPDGEKWDLLEGWPEPTLYDRVVGWFKPSTKYSIFDFPLEPEILRGGAETEPVLRQLEQEPMYRPLVEQARQNAKLLSR